MLILLAWMEFLSLHLVTLSNDLYFFNVEYIFNKDWLKIKQCSFDQLTDLQFILKREKQLRVHWPENKKTSTFWKQVQDFFFLLFCRIMQIDWSTFSCHFKIWQTEKCGQVFLCSRERILGDNEIHNNWDSHSEKGLDGGK